ncbi:MAG TPA: hypothetical protein VD973_23580 [Symbiobacteriaceae bacterium]|jgi:CBS domain containing-hemolysin-like protein|nr:hypothetical protein [Symbiobacteriaceae bacterium]
MAQEPSSPPWWRRAIRVGLLSFLLAAVVNYLGQEALESVPALVAMLIILMLITVGISFDILGTSVTAAEVTPLNAMAAKRLSGARQAIFLVRNADRVANFANDVVGDVTGAVTGAAGSTVAMQLSTGKDFTDTLLSLAIIGLVAGLTVGGKAAGKTFAIEHATDVLVLVGRAIHTVERMIGRSLTGGRGPNSSRRRTT